MDQDIPATSVNHIRGSPHGELGTKVQIGPNRLHSRHGTLIQVLSVKPKCEPSRWLAERGILGPDVFPQYSHTSPLVSLPCLIPMTHHFLGLATFMISKPKAKGLGECLCLSPSSRTSRARNIGDPGHLL